MLEVVHSIEDLPADIDFIIALGKNIGVDSSPQDIRDNPLHLSIESRITTLAAGELYRPGMDIMFSGGKTAGEEYPTEPEASFKYLRRRFPEIPMRAILLENTSIDTADNAEKAEMILRSRHYEHIALLGVGYHVENAATIFDRYDVPIDVAIAAEDIVAERSHLHQAYVVAWKGLDRVRKEKIKEKIRTGLLHTIDRRGKLLRHVTSRTRR